MPDYEPPVCETTPVSAEVTRLYRYGLHVVTLTDRNVLAILKMHVL